MDDCLIFSFRQLRRYAKEVPSATLYDLIFSLSRFSTEYT